MSDLRYAETYLETCALGYVAVRRDDPPDVEGWRAWGQTLRESAVRYAAACGDLSAAERAELESLRRIRDGIVSLRGEVVADRTSDGQPMTAALVVETIDAILKMNGTEQL